jgi:GT2 family glycosyltransferase
MGPVSVCICTRNRPHDLSKTLTSIEESSIPVSHVVVADDSTDAETAVLLASRFPRVVYLRGAQRGLGANRNLALSAATSKYVILLDDDCRLAPNFIATAFAQLAGRATAAKWIITGSELNGGAVIGPSRPSFLGFQEHPCMPGECAGLAMNSTLYPLAMFDEIHFDERLVYGYDEVDLAARARSTGWGIWFAPEAQNHHYPSPRNRSFYRPHTEASRLYVTYKRYRYVERRRLKLIVFIAIAPLHLFASACRRGGPGPRGALTILWRAVLYARSYARATRLSDQPELWRE